MGMVSYGRATNFAIGPLGLALAVGAAVYLWCAWDFAKPFRSGLPGRLW